jgi:hypothetical protein
MMAVGRRGAVAAGKKEETRMIRCDVSERARKFSTVRNYSMKILEETFTWEKLSLGDNW